MKIFSRRPARIFLLGVVVFSLVGVVAYSVRVNQSNAMLGFGGKITSVVYCPCSANLAITIVGVKGGVFSFGPGSLPFAWYQIFRPGPWAKGTYVPGNVCLWFIPYGCAGFPTMGTIVEVGTSM